MNGLFSIEQQQAFVLARLRSYGPAFDYELKAECYAPDPTARVAELIEQGYRIDALKSFRTLPDGALGWTLLYVLRVKRMDNGAVVSAPAGVGIYAVERWRE